MYYKPLGAWAWLQWLGWSGSPSYWFMAQVMYYHNGRMNYWNSKPTWMSLDAVAASCLRADSCGSNHRCDIQWPNRPNDCSPGSPATPEEAINIKYWVWENSRWLALPYAKAMYYSGPRDPTLPDVMDIRNYGGVADLTALKHGKLHGSWQPSW